MFWTYFLAGGAAYLAYVAARPTYRVRATLEADESSTELWMRVRPASAEEFADVALRMRDAAPACAACTTRWSCDAAGVCVGESVCQTPDGEKPAYRSSLTLELGRASLRERLGFGAGE